MTNHDLIELLSEAAVEIGNAQAMDELSETCGELPEVGEKEGV